MSVNLKPSDSTFFSRNGTVVSKSLLMRMSPAGVTTKNEPSCAVPTKYRLSITLCGGKGAFQSVWDCGDCASAEPHAIERPSNSEKLRMIVSLHGAPQ